MKSADRSIVLVLWCAMPDDQLLGNVKHCVDERRSVDSLDLQLSVKIVVNLALGLTNTSLDVVTHMSLSSRSRTSAR